MLLRSIIKDELLNDSKCPTVAVTKFHFFSYACHPSSIQVLQSLRMLLLLKPHTLLKVSRQVSFALHELLRTNAANIHSSQDWSTLFTLLECVGAGCKPPKVINSDNSSENESSNLARSGNGTSVDLLSHFFLFFE